MSRKIKGQEIHLKGYPICPGIAIARPFLFVHAEENVPEFEVANEQIDKEVNRYYLALRSSRQDLLSLQKRMLKEGGQEAADILATHIEMIGDPLMTVEVEQEIRRKGKNTEYVFKSVMGKYEKKFSRITDVFFKERLNDFQDVSRRVICHLRKHERVNLAQLSTPSVVFAHELAPSDTAEANSEVIEAFVTRSGSKTSHVAIMARAKGIPFVTNIDFPDLAIAIPPLVIVDGNSGLVIVNPARETVETYRKEQKKIRVQGQTLAKTGQLEAKTTDGCQVRLSGNIEMFQEIEALKQNGGEGVGLFRSEYLFLARDGFPSEEEQFNVYKQLVETVGEHISVIRTFDIGGDKLGQINMSRHEQNPYLGCRAIRLMLKEKALFKAQLRAILRASAFGELAILYPMISGVAELREANQILAEAKEELFREGVPYADELSVGCMIEVPSAAMVVDHLLEECDFISIGTNDLVQYALAVDRSNAAMNYLYTAAHPSVIRLLKQVVEVANRMEKPVSVCGEIASDPRYTPLLLGLGVKELSLSPPALPLIKSVVRSLSLEECEAFVASLDQYKTAAEIEAVLESKSAQSSKP